MLLPRPDSGVVAAEPPGSGPGYWSGAPCAAAGDGEIFLAYRLRRPIGQGRGYAVAVARSSDGERFETLLQDVDGVNPIDTTSVRQFEAVPPSLFGAEFVPQLHPSAIQR